MKKGQPINIKESLTISNKSQSSYKNLIKTSKNDKGKQFKVVTITELGILYFNQNGENKIKNSNVLAVDNELN